jgi:hypothetical protein
MESGFFRLNVTDAENASLLASVCFVWTADCETREHFLAVEVVYVTHRMGKCLLRVAYSHSQKFRTCSVVRFRNSGPKRKVYSWINRAYRM